MSADGSTILTEGASQAGDVGNPPPAVVADPTTAAGMTQAVMDGPPEYIPPKFWDGEKKAPKIEDLGKSYMNLEKLLGREKVPLPQSEEDEDGWTRWYAAAGRPEKPDEYEFERPELPADLPYDEETEKSYRAWAHANGLNKKQAKSLYDGFVKNSVERHAAWQNHQKEMRAKAQMDLQREFGPQYEAKVAKARAALRKYADPDYYKHLDETGAGNDARMIRAWIKIGDEMAGDERLKGKVAETVTPQDIDRTISEFRSKNEKALYDKSHPNHQHVVNELYKLHSARHPQ